MNQRAKWKVALASIASVAFGYACSTPSTNYGNPNALDRRTIPGDGGTEELICSTDGGTDARAGDGGCSTSWSRDLYPQFLETGAWKCSSAQCHGKAANPPAPALNGRTPSEVLAQMRQATVQVGGAPVPYIPRPDAGGMDVRSYTFLCNLHGDCGSRMPQPPGKDLETAELCKVSAWINCGAPEN